MLKPVMLVTPAFPASDVGSGGGARQGIDDVVDHLDDEVAVVALAP